MKLTFGLIKPDAVVRGLVGKLICEIEAAGFQFQGLTMVTLKDGHLLYLYRHHTSKDYWPNLYKTMVNKKAIAFSVSHPSNTDVAKTFREFAKELRSEFMVSNNSAENVIHSSEPEAVKFELSIFFPGVV